MAKRAATSELNHDNWDREEEAEDSGTFEKAPEEVIKKRVIKVAKRRNPLATSGGDDKEKPNIFGGFTGFAKSSTTSNSSNNNFYSFLTDLTKKTDEPKTNGTTSTGGTTNEKKDTTNEKVKDDKSSLYYAKLKGLNESVSKWISKHVSENPLVNLQPIFKDYDRYFADLEKLNETDKTTTSTTKQPEFTFGSQAANANSTTTAPKFNFGSNTIPKFSFGSSGTTGNSTTTTATFSFGQTNKTNEGSTSSSTSSLSTTFGTSSTNISFGNTSGSSKPFSFGSGNLVANPASTLLSKNTENTENDDNAENNEDEPPKVEFTPVVEEGHVYTIRCKVFVKKDGSFGDRGVGNLYLKPVPNSEKYQLIVRADTNLGNLLCNFILSEGLPMQRMGKKDVMLVCIPTPDAKPPPVPILLRVKTTEDADELLKTLQKYQK